MKKALFLAMIAIVSLAATGFAQTNSGVNLLESPYKIEAETSTVGETLTCTVLLGGGTASAFGVDVYDYDGGLSPTEFIGNELFGPALGGSWRVFHFDETCTVLGTWVTAFASGLTSTGTSFDESTGTTYWNNDPFGTASIIEYTMFSGVATGASWPLPTGTPGVWGPLAIDNNQPGKLSYTEDIADDRIYEVDLTSGAVGGSFANPDNAGTGAYGNGLSEAKDPSFCGGATLVVSSGTIGEFQVTRCSQMIANVGGGCYNTWEIMTLTSPSGEYFPNGVEEFISALGGDRRLMVWGNVTGLIYNIGKPLGINDCQGIDSPDSDVVYANGSQGAGYVVKINSANPLGMAIVKPPAGGNGKYVVHMNNGVPSSGTITALPAALGSACFPLLIPPAGSASPEAIWNNIGKTDKVGASMYFNTGTADPAKAPAFFHQGFGDPANLPLGVMHTVQGVIINPTGTSPKLASVTNGLILDVTADT